MNIGWPKLLVGGIKHVAAINGCQFEFDGLNMSIINNNVASTLDLPKMEELAKSENYDLLTDYIVEECRGLTNG